MRIEFGRIFVSEKWRCVQSVEAPCSYWHFLSTPESQMHIGSLFAACILYGFFINATVPIFYELAVEGTYPVAEGITTMIIVLLNQSSGLVYISIKMIPGVGECKLVIKQWTL